MSTDYESENSEPPSPQTASDDVDGGGGDGEGEIAPAPPSYYSRGPGRHAPPGQKPKTPKTACRTCSRPGCGKWAIQGGLCWTHGGRQKRKTCRVEGCPNLAKKGGVCFRHGANLTVAPDHPCRIEGCARRRYGSHGLCEKHARRAGLIKPPPICTVEGCTRQVRKQGLCAPHGGWVLLCEVEGCTKRPARSRRCWEHGGKNDPKWRCKVEGCTRFSARWGLCKAHGGTRICKVEGCTNQVLLRGMCRRHGPKDQRKQCEFEGCTTEAKRGGFCYKHRPDRPKTFDPVGAAVAEKIRKLQEKEKRRLRRQKLLEEAAALLDDGKAGGGPFGEGDDVACVPCPKIAPLVLGREGATPEGAQSICRSIVEECVAARKRNPRGRVPVGLARMLFERHSPRFPRLTMAMIKIGLRQYNARCPTEGIAGVEGGGLRGSEDGACVEASNRKSLERRGRPKRDGSRGTEEGAVPSDRPLHGGAEDPENDSDVADNDDAPEPASYDTETDANSAVNAGDAEEDPDERDEGAADGPAGGIGVDRRPRDEGTQSICRSIVEECVAARRRNPRGRVPAGLAVRLFERHSRRFPRLTMGMIRNGIWRYNARCPTEDAAGVEGGGLRGSEDGAPPDGGGDDAENGSDESDDAPRVNQGVGASSRERCRKRPWARDQRKGGGSNGKAQEDDPRKVSRRSLDKPLPMQDIAEPSFQDFLINPPWGLENTHQGNVLFRRQAYAWKTFYLASKLLGRELCVATEIIQEWRSRKPPGRFLTYVDTKRSWQDVGDKAAAVKVCHLLNEMTRHDEECAQGHVPRPAASKDLAEAAPGAAETTGPEKPLPTQDIIVPRIQDVLVGTSWGLAGTHQGNVLFRRKADAWKTFYLASKQLGREMSVAAEIIQEWRLQEPPGRFLAYAYTKRSWHEVGDTVATLKVCQLLSEMTRRDRERSQGHVLRPAASKALAEAAPGAAETAGLLVVSKSRRRLTEIGKGEAPGQRVKQQLRELQAMGFEDRAANIRALASSLGDLVKAIQILQQASTLPTRDDDMSLGSLPGGSAFGQANAARNRNAPTVDEENGSGAIVDTEVGSDMPRDARDADGSRGCDEEDEDDGHLGASEPPPTPGGSGSPWRFASRSAPPAAARRRRPPAETATPLISMQRQTERGQREAQERRVDQQLQELQAMGFEDRSANIHALASSCGDMVRAIQILLGVEKGSKEGAAAPPAVHVEDGKNVSDVARPVLAPLVREASEEDGDVKGKVSDHCGAAANANQRIEFAKPKAPKKRGKLCSKKPEAEGAVTEAFVRRSNARTTQSRPAIVRTKAKRTRTRHEREGARSVKRKVSTLATDGTNINPVRGRNKSPANVGKNNDECVSKLKAALRETSWHDFSRE